MHRETVHGHVSRGEQLVAQQAQPRVSASMVATARSAAAPQPTMPAALSFLERTAALLAAAVQNRLRGQFPAQGEDAHTLGAVELVGRHRERAT